MLFLKADKWELCKNGAVVAAVRNKSKTLVSRMEALASSSGKEWLHGEVNTNQRLEVSICRKRTFLFKAHSTDLGLRS